MLAGISQEIKKSDFFSDDLNPAHTSSLYYSLAAIRSMIYNDDNDDDVDDEDKEEEDGDGGCGDSDDNFDFAAADVIHNCTIMLFGW